MPLTRSAINSKIRKSFTGKEFDNDGASGDDENGMNLYYFGKRYYDPEIGRWVSTDPKEQYWDAYSYTGGNPINLIDLDGLEANEKGDNASEKNDNEKQDTPGSKEIDKTDKSKDKNKDAQNIDKKSDSKSKKSKDKKDKKKNRKKKLSWWVRLALKLFGKPSSKTAVELVIEVTKETSKQTIKNAADAKTQKTEKEKQARKAQLEGIFSDSALEACEEVLDSSIQNKANSW